MAPIKTDLMHAVALKAGWRVVSTGLAHDRNEISYRCEKVRDPAITTKVTVPLGALNEMGNLLYVQLLMKG